MIGKVDIDTFIFYVDYHFMPFEQLLKTIKFEFLYAPKLQAV